MENQIIPLNIQLKEVSKKKRTEYKFLLYIVISIFTIAFSIIGFNLLKEYHRSKEINNIFVHNVYSDKKAVVNAINLVKNLPVKVIDKLIEHNIKVDFITWEPDENAAGQFRGLDKLILVQYANSEDSNLFTKYQVELVTLHEIAHAFDYDYSINLTGYAYSGIKEFDDIYKEEARKLFNTDNFKNTNQSYLDYHANTRWEYFAHCFALYYVNSETNQVLYEKAPETYKFIKKVSAPIEKYTFIKFIKNKFTKI